MNKFDFVIANFHIAKRMFADDSACYNSVGKAVKDAYIKLSNSQDVNQMCCNALTQEIDLIKSDVRDKISQATKGKAEATKFDIESFFS